MYNIKVCEVQIKNDDVMQHLRDLNKNVMVNGIAYTKILLKMLFKIQKQIKAQNCYDQKWTSTQHDVELLDYEHKLRIIYKFFIHLHRTTAQPINSVQDPHEMHDKTQTKYVLRICCEENKRTTT